MNSPEPRAIPDSQLELKTRRIFTHTELYALWKIDNAASRVEFESLQNWWRAFPAGVRVHCEIGALVAAYAVWPLRDNRFDAFMRGEIVEQRLQHTDFELEHRAKSWLLTDIVVREQSRMKGIGTAMMREALDYCAKMGAERLATIAATPDGTLLLRRTGFVFSNARAGQHLVAQRRVLPNKSLADSGR